MLGHKCWVKKSYFSDSDSSFESDFSIDFCLFCFCLFGVCFGCLGISVLSDETSDWPVSDSSELSSDRPFVPIGASARLCLRTSL